MGNNHDKTRRNFFTQFFSSGKKNEKVKMLTPDGKLVEIDKKILDEAAKKKLSSNKELYDWMQNPSKENK